MTFIQELTASQMFEEIFYSEKEVILEKEDKNTICPSKIHISAYNDIELAAKILSIRDRLTSPMVYLVLGSIERHDGMVSISFAIVGSDVRLKLKG